MNNLEKVATSLGVAVVIFGGGVAWQGLNSRVDRVKDRLDAIEQDRSEGLCLTILKSQVASIDKGKSAAREQLSSLSDRYCPHPVANAEQGMSATRTMTADELKRAIEEQNREYAAVLKEVANINKDLNGHITPPDGAQCEPPNC